jgi:hypothetical protein
MRDVAKVTASLAGSTSPNPALEHRSAGTVLIAAQRTDEEEKRRVERADRRGKFGLALLIAGFAFQLSSVVAGHPVTGRVGRQTDAVAPRLSRFSV